MDKRREWCKKWIETNARDDLNDQSLAKLAILSYEKEFPYEKSAQTNADITKYIYDELKNDRTYNSSGRQQNQQGKVDSHFGKPHKAYAELDAIKKYLKKW